MVEPGAVLGGRYRVGRTLGKGGMGVVVEAMHVQLGTLVAVKVLRDDLAKESHLVERFLREARASAQLRGEHICRVQDFGTSDDGVPFMVLELLQGRDLSTMLKQSGPLAVPNLARYVVQICAGVAEPHALGMVHRDLKPGNLFVIQRPDGTPAIKILDFGIAKIAPTIDFSATSTGNVMGSPAYMSPEQLKSSKNVDVRSDIWSIGVVMYELVSGNQPFKGETMTELALSITGDPLPDLPASVPAGFAAVIARCLEKDPAKRFADVGALAIAVAPFASEETKELASSVARTLIATRSGAGVNEGGDEVATVFEKPAKEITTLGTATGPVTGAPTDLRPSKRWMFGLAGILVLGIGGVAVVGLGGGDKSSEPRPAPAKAPIEQPPPPPPPPVAPPPVVAPDAAPAATPPLDAAVEPPVDAGVVNAPVIDKRKNKRLPKKSGDFGKSRY